jgi:hypothetical protein
MLRIILTTVIFHCLVLVGLDGGIGKAYAGTPDKAGNNAEIYLISITPNSVLAGSYPEISGFVQDTSNSKNGKNYKAVFDVMAVVTAPNKSQKSLVWHNVSFSSGQKKFYRYANNFDNKQAGTYQVLYSVYNSDRTHRYASLSKSFTINEPVATAKPLPPSETTTKQPEAEKNDLQQKNTIKTAANEPLATADPLPPPGTATKQPEAAKNDQQQKTAAKTTANTTAAKTTVSFKTWYNTWEKTVGIAPDEWSATSNAVFMAGPAVNVEFSNNVFLGGSFLFATSDFELTQSDIMIKNSNRKDLDLMAGYMFTPRFGAFLGYTYMTADTTIEAPIGTLDSKSDSVWNGPGVGILGNIPVNKTITLYGSLSFMSLKASSTSTAGSGSYNTDGVSVEIGALFALSPQSTINMGYKYWEFSGDIDGVFFGDKISGFTAGFNYMF